MIKVTRSTALLAFGASLILWGCGGGGGSAPVLTGADAALAAKIAATNPRGLAGYLLPDSGDYGSIPQDPKNPITNAKVELGAFLFHETGFLRGNLNDQGSETSSCSICHNAAAGFQANRFQGIGEGGLGFGASGEARQLDPSYLPGDRDTQPIRSPSAMNMAYQTNILWNGQFGATHLNVGTQSQWFAGTPKVRNFLGFEGLETQAIAGQGVHRLTVNEQTVSELGYTAMFDAAYPELAKAQRYTDITAGLAIAAYERTLLANQSPWQLWLRGDSAAMTSSQKAGADLFFGKANCYSCHGGPALANMEFDAIGMNDLYVLPGCNSAKRSSVENKGRGGFTGHAEDLYKFKVPQLYNLTDSRFYGHGSSFHSVRDVIVYKNNAVPENSDCPMGQLSPLFKPLGLTNSEIDELTDFIENALYDPNLSRYVPRALPSGLVFPANDPVTRAEHGL